MIWNRFCPRSDSPHVAESDAGGPSASQRGRRASQSPIAARRPSAAVPAPATASTGLSREKDIKMPLSRREKLENAERALQREKLSRPVDLDRFKFRIATIAYVKGHQILRGFF